MNKQKVYRNNRIYQHSLNDVIDEYVSKYRIISCIVLPCDTQFLDSAIAYSLTIIYSEV